ncbi:MAG: MFS transporter [archaeon]
MNRQTRVLLAGNTLWSFATGMFAPLLAVFTEKVGGSLLDISTAWAIFLVVTGVATILLGKHMNHPQRQERILVGGYFLVALLYFAYLFVENTWQLFLVEGGFGIAQAMVNPTWYALFSRHHDPEKSGDAWGLSEGLQSILMGVGTVLGGIIVSLHGFNSLFLLMGVLQLGVAGIYTQLNGKIERKQSRMKK